MPSARKSTSAKRKANSDGDFVDVNFYNPHETVSGRLPGLYLDQVERENAETRRAKLEDRDPDYDQLPATAGTPLTTSDNLAPIGVRDGEVHPNDDEVSAEPYITLPVSVGGAPETVVEDDLEEE